MYYKSVQVNPQASNQQEAVLCLTCVGEDTQVLTSRDIDSWYLPPKGCIHSLDWTIGMDYWNVLLDSICFVFLPITVKLNHRSILEINTPFTTRHNNMHTRRIKLAHYSHTKNYIKTSV